MAEEFNFKLDIGHALGTFLHSQFFGTPPYPTQSFSNQVIIVTGSNVGLGFEAARHFYRLDCAKLILAVRTISKGQTAKEDIVRSVKHRSDGAEAIEVWPLDLSSTESTLAFAERVKKELLRVDAVVENAGINHQSWVVSEGFEQIIQVNVVNTLLLGLSLLPKLRETRRKFPESSPHLEIVSSEGHHFTNFKEVNAPDIYAALNDEKRGDMLARYPVSKLIDILFVRELVLRLQERDKSSTETAPPVTITLVNPGFCVSDLDRNMILPARILMYVVRMLLGRSTEVGSRTLVYGASAGPGSHGEFMSDGKNQEVEKWIYSDLGKKAQVKVFEQTMRVLEARKPGIGAEVGLPA
ncbi:uncharacterized protein Z520_07907 [Fonsecaea multimorphosa CBS 102226]|uniref:NAD(P)-binding protein n=1 Tax=Fonsecaea multimorphosa CBS 102226 TaxID=1442371 RepID=A0A0D2IHX2_9EURO|nr:uncharacterized protein Z520_07907 [Fonsecaea multimorphosa CBS 102226]KIX96641.1 hypothetical protein Z520_07907 [Fonsecaea multimorphosa CBS 102226]OAL17486.1 hypothetical protein AYO22_11618 [Fonsecaea multimorphosa]